MFPPNLQKNIQELERQISLLETECEHMEVENQETSPSGKPNRKSSIRELLNKPFITGPSVSVLSYSSKLLPPTVPKIYSVSCAHFRPANEKSPHRATLPKSLGVLRSNRSVGFNNFKHLEKKQEETIREESKCSPPHDAQKSNANVLEKYESPVVQKLNPGCDRENKKDSKRSVDSIKEGSESTEENHLTRIPWEKPKPRSNSSKEQTWRELLREPSPSASKSKNKKPAEAKEPSVNFRLSEPKLSSDEECRKDKFFSGNWISEARVSSENRISSKRRPRSARTKKNRADEIPMDINMSKVLREKETQCALGNEEKEKDEFFLGLNESIKILHLLIGELKTKMSREKRDDVLNDMQNTLMKISDIRWMGPVNNPLTSLSSLKETNLKLLEKEEKFTDVKNTFFALKQFCQKVSDEKSVLTEKIKAKNRALASCKSKEKEYLSLISCLKFNLEKVKEEADEGTQAKRDLKVQKTKLQEETKVIEALKKSHEKMQELVENYVLENDKLKTQVKIAKLEAHKFNVLMAGKEAEIKKYKKEIESFQKQITEQLSLLRSRATENEVEQTIEAIRKQRNLLQTEDDSFKSQLDTTFEGADFNENLDAITVGSTTTITLPKVETKQASPYAVNARNNNAWETQSNSSQEVEKPRERNEVFTSNESETETHPSKRQYGLEKVLFSSKNLRISINELLEDIRRESTDMSWLSPSNSCASSSQSARVSTSSEVSEGERSD